MKKLISILSLALCAAFFGCNTGTTQLGYELAQQNKYEKAYEYQASKDDLNKALLYALDYREWKIESKSPIRASLATRNYDAKLKAEVSDNMIKFDTTGSKFEGKDIVPLRLLDYLNKSVKQNLRESKK
ncbi:MAG: hypothetical protein J6T16_03970 [Opitutales bacterium]|nr:hypothetical protein [Opitutales bacterium]